MHLLLQQAQRVVLTQEKHLVRREIGRRPDQPVPPAADRRTKMLDVLDVKRRSVHRKDSHGRVGRQLGAIRCQGKGYGQKLLHLVDAAEHQGRQLADAVAEGEPRLANGDVENLFEDSDLRELHPDDRADILHEGREVGGLAAEHPGREVDLFAERIAAERRG